MYNDEELMLFAESYQKMQRKGTAGKKIIGTVSERLNESIDSQIKTAKLKKMVKTLLECEKMKSAKEFLNSISLTECKAKDLAKVEKLYKFYEEIEDVEEAEEEEVEEAEDDEAEGDPDVAVIKSGFISDYKSDKLSLYKFLQAIVEFGQWIMTHGKNEERNVMKSLLAVLEDEFIPKFAELPGATDDSTVDDEPADDADDADEEIPADAEDDEEADTEDDDVDIDVDAEIDDEDDDTSDDEPADDEEDIDVEVDDEEPAEDDVEEAEEEEEVEESTKIKKKLNKTGINEAYKKKTTYEIEDLKDAYDSGLLDPNDEQVKRLGEDIVELLIFSCMDFYDKYAEFEVTDKSNDLLNYLNKCVVIHRNNVDEVYDWLKLNNLKHVTHGKGYNRMFHISDYADWDADEDDRYIVVLANKTDRNSLKDLD